ncbi:hypothetical protein TNCV_4719751 [Trichonephila clavipes]|uniref:Uncharacterized protein n=1 Tax=Trichonephila clavipes TaxID=2585209 RepID=A0A8X6W6D7_TRICX|nr:hypothetical protein TNCV_4719751 [Trichonephila clavipes]
MMSSKADLESERIINPSAISIALASLSCIRRGFFCCCLRHPNDSNIKSRPMEFIAARGCIYAPVVSCCFEHHTGDSTIWLSSNPISRPPTFLTLPPTKEELRLVGYLKYPKGIIHLQTSMASPGFEPDSQRH